MADNQVTIPVGTTQAKKRRIPGACDECKRKKVKCDSTKMPDNRCTNCIQQSLECSHIEVGKTLGPAKRYVESLEARLEKMDMLFNKMLPGLDMNEELAKLDRGEEEPDKLPRNDDETSALAQQMGKLTLLNPLGARFLGKSSNVQLFKTCLDMKWQYTGKAQAETSLTHGRRSTYWDIPKWAEQNQMDTQPSHLFYTFPPDDLMTSLIDLYFTYLNPLLPLLHRPIFERSVEQGLHLRNTEFGATLLLVCAHGSKYSEDPRIMVDGTNTWLSSGWKWYNQVRALGQQLPSRCTLYTLQVFTLLTLFAVFSPVQDNCWIQTGMALRLAVDVGIHTKKGKESSPTPESELWKRAFWCCWVLDHRYSAVFGRSPSLKDEDVDLEFPLECDDEYWDHDFQQPASKPSELCYLTALLKLTQIFGRTMRLVYSLKRYHSTFQKAPMRPEQEFLSELDASLNDWRTTLPPHLRCGKDSQYTSDTFKVQAAYLKASFYHHQICVYRPYIPSLHNPVQSPIPALLICKNAAQSCLHALETMRTLHSVLSPTTLDIYAVLGRVLLISIWSGLSSSESRQLEEDLKKCNQAMENAEDRWFTAGRCTDMMNALSHDALPAKIRQGGHVLPQTKRSYDESEIPDPLHSFDSSSHSSLGNSHRAIAGSRRVSLLNQVSQPSSFNPLGMHLSLVAGNIPQSGEVFGSSLLPAISGHLQASEINGSSGPMAIDHANQYLNNIQPSLQTSVPSRTNVNVHSTDLQIGSGHLLGTWDPAFDGGLYSGNYDLTNFWPPELQSLSQLDVWADWMLPTDNFMIPRGTDQEHQGMNFLY